MLQSAINLSEGRDEDLLVILEQAAGNCLVDRHSDASHHRSVFTLLGSDTEVFEAACRLTACALDLLDLTTHAGVHPRFGVVDVVPFVPFLPDRNHSTPVDFVAAEEAAQRFIDFAHRHGLATARYGLGTRTLPEMRKLLREGRGDGLVDGPANLRHGITLVGVRDVLVAWNLWVEEVTLEELRRVAKALRTPALRTLALELDGGQLQLSCNVVLPFDSSLSDIVAATREQLPPQGQVTGGELVGLLPRDLLRKSPRDEWEFLGISEEQTLEWNATHHRG